jgi:hypothetical protein
MRPVLVMFGVVGYHLASFLVSETALLTLLYFFNYCHSIGHFISEHPL